ncbi:MAG: preprotein translocase subunit SecE [Elusimicrobiaceae bacterium]|jgi:preprotein translocase subunit SecE|nr:preprotein translocase subunit SecE [Elusimicrobiaceae bacterium]MBT3954781.1 preprotein translocase subunit SecE [Elusimicrobiaceae bacterium]MBT4008775.1 preprotein translocase subunit SecE [Elusimicrobiaceae bacterium]MBT4402281.1 preprotein translocase subunit SecE [Elusimicrobiaceae bacterium]MBT4440262.1 preprotein translocase subunit SecE [Elusimicrobiaceae bacterium]
MNVISKSTRFVKEAYAELGKVKWFSKQEVIQSTILVTVVVVLVAIYVGLIDLILSKFISMILGG